MRITWHHAIRYVYPSYFKSQVCWLRSLTRITHLSKLIGIHSLTAFLQLELFRVYTLFFFTLSGMIR
ncbi:hypothetical protein W909_02180 [Dickeya zeae EC1]|nr:hypothetical protein W909_02180 [Dickeya zeae EC1]